MSLSWATTVGSTGSSSPLLKEIPRPFLGWGREEMTVAPKIITEGGGLLFDTVFF
jgi:hypothetical protein